MNTFLQRVYRLFFLALLSACCPPCWAGDGVQLEEVKGGAAQSPAVLGAPVSVDAPPQAVAPAPAAKDAGVFARVNGKVITPREYQAAYVQAVRNKFYHGKPPEGELALLQREVANDMLVKILLVDEAHRRNLQPNRAKVENALAAHERRNAQNEQWQKSREALMPALTKRFEEDTLPNILEEEVKKLPPPNEDELRAYYAAHPDLFTEPQKSKVSLMLLRVPPAAEMDMWQQADKAAFVLKERMEKGEDFANLAREFSEDVSAKAGGDLGYVHAGVLATEVEKVLDGLKDGEVSPPIRTLRGVVMVRLDGRKMPQLNAFEAVRERAGDLLMRERQKNTWEAFRRDLRKQAEIFVDLSHFDPLPDPAKVLSGTPAAPQKKEEGAPPLGVGNVEAGDVTANKKIQAPALGLGKDAGKASSKRRQKKGATQ